MFSERLEQIKKNLYILKKESDVLLLKDRKGLEVDLTVTSSSSSTIECGCQVGC